MRAAMEVFLGVFFALNITFAAYSGYLHYAALHFVALIFTEILIHPNKDQPK